MNKIKCEIEFLVFLMFVFQFIGCKKSDNKNTDSIPLQNEWILSAVQSTLTHKMIQYPASFDRQESVKFTDTLVILSGLCNGGQGKYLVKDKNLTITTLITTQRACADNEYNNWEDFMANNLTDSYSFEISDKTLLIYSKGDYNLVFTLK